MFRRANTLPQDGYYVSCVAHHGSIRQRITMADNRSVWPHVLAVLSLALCLVSYVLDSYPLVGSDCRPGIMHPRTSFPLYTSMLLGMQARARRAATRTYASQRANEPSGSMPSCLGSSPIPVTPLPTPYLLPLTSHLTFPLHLLMLPPLPLPRRSVPVYA